MEVNGRRAATRRPWRGVGTRMSKSNKCRTYPYIILHHWVPQSVSNFSFRRPSDPWVHFIYICTSILQRKPKDCFRPRTRIPPRQWYESVRATYNSKECSSVPSIPLHLWHIYDLWSCVFAVFSSVPQLPGQIRTRSILFQGQCCQLTPVEHVSDSKRQL